MPGKARLFHVHRLKSSIVLTFGVKLPGSTSYALMRKQKSRSTRYWRGLRGCTMNMPIIPIAICVISSACGWYMNVPDFVSRNS